MFRSIAAIVVMVLVLAVIVAYRLAQGPISLDFLTPSIEQALRAPDGSISGHLGKTDLVWNRAGGTLEIRASNVQLLAMDGAQIASAPDMSILLSGAALLKGTIAIRRARILNPYLRIVITPDGKVGFSQGNGAGDQSAGKQYFLDGVIRSLLTPGSAGQEAGLSANIELIDAHLDIVDLAHGEQWQATNANLDLRHDGRDLTGQAEMDFAAGKWTSHVSAFAKFVSDSQTLKAAVQWHDLDPAVLAPLGPALAQLAVAQFPTSGTASFGYSPDHGMTDVQFNLTGGPGSFDATQWLGASYKVTSLSAKGTLSTSVPGGGFDGVTLDQLKLDLGGPNIVFSGKAEALTTQPVISGDIELNNTPVDDLKVLWPAKVAPEPRTWIIGHIIGGTLKKAAAKLKGSLKPGQNADAFEPDELSGELEIDGATLHYLPPLPPLRNVSSKATFDKEGMKFTISGGDSEGVALKNGTVVLAGFGAKLQTATINGTLAASAADALKLLDRQPLGYADAIGLSPAQVGGDIEANLNITLPLIDSLKLADVKIKGNAHATHLSIANIFSKLNMNEGDLTLAFDSGGMDVNGTAQLGGRPATIKWRENFDRSAIKSRYDVAMILDDATRASLGYGQGPFQPPYLSGPVGLTVIAQLAAKGRGTIKVNADLTNASLHLPDLAWHKDAGTAGTAEAQMDLTAGQVTQISRFQILSQGFELAGMVTMESGDPRKVVFNRAKWGRTNVSGSLSILPKDAGLTLDVMGPSFDASELLGNAVPVAEQNSNIVAPVQVRVEAKVATKPPPGTEPEHTPLAISAKINKIWLSATGSIDAVSLSMRRDRHIWQNVEITGTPDQGQPLRVLVQPTTEKTRALSVTSADAGSVFRNFDIFPNVIGGSLDVSGTYDDSHPTHTLTGKLGVSDFRLIRAPFVAHLLNIAGVAGIVDMLSGPGIPFSHLDAPFTLTDGVLALKDAHASGASLGLTAHGEVDLDRDRIALEGTIIPIYMLNSILGNIPLVGNILTNGPGGGLIAMNYSVSGKTDNPSMSVNPLAVLAPGFLRGLFNIFGSDTTVRPDEPAGTPATPAKP